MKKTIQSYFLFLSESPFLFNFMIWFLFLILYLIPTLIIKSITQKPGEDLIINSNLIIIITLIFFVNTLIIYWVRKKYITIKGDNDHNYLNYLFTILVTNSGEKIHLKEAVWEKGKRFIITHTGLSKFSDDEFSFDTSLTGKFGNTRICIPVSVILKFKEGFDPLEVFEQLEKDVSIKNDYEKRILVITKHFINMFNKINETNKDKIEAEMLRFTRREISESQLLNLIIDYVNFPERPFSNIKEVNICLKEPQVSSCKGISCPG